MKHSVQFFYRPSDSPRPNHIVQDEPFESDAAIPIPRVGDTVSYKYDGRDIFKKVETIHNQYYIYEGETKIVTLITVIDVSDDEMSSRLSKF